MSEPGHQHRFTVAVEWEYVEREIEVPDYSTGMGYYRVLQPGMKKIMSRVGERVTRLRCETCPAEVEREEPRRG